MCCGNSASVPSNQWRSAPDVPVHACRCMPLKCTAQGSGGAQAPESRDMQLRMPQAARLAWLTHSVQADLRGGGHAEGWVQVIIMMVWMRGLCLRRPPVRRRSGSAETPTSVRHREGAYAPRMLSRQPTVMMRHHCRSMRRDIRDAAARKRKSHAAHGSLSTSFPLCQAD
jgi:hypothetical protein